MDMDKLDYVLVGMAQLGPNSAIKLLWARYGATIMRVAVSQSRKRQSDFQLNGLSNDERYRALLADCYIHFQSAIMNYDASRGVPLVKYLVQRVVWNIASEKRRNSAIYSREKVVDDPSFWDSDLLVDESADFEESSRHKRMVESIGREVADNPKLSRFWEHCVETFNLYDKCEEAEVARRMGCCRPTVYMKFEKLYRLLLK